MIKIKLDRELFVFILLKHQARIEAFPAFGFKASYGLGLFIIKKLL